MAISFTGSPGFDGALDDAHVDDHAAVGVECGVEGQGLKAILRLAARGRDALHDGFQDFLDADAGLGAGEERLFGGDGQDVLDLALDAWQVGIWQGRSC